MKLLASILASLMLVSPAFADAVEVDTSAGAFPLVTIAEVKRAEVQARVPLSGTLRAREEVLIYPHVSGHSLVELVAEIGDSVQQGQVLARLSRDTLVGRVAQAEAEYQRAQAGVSQAKSQIDSAKATLTQTISALSRAQRLRNSGNTAQAALDDAVAGEAAAQAAAASAADGLQVAQAALAQAAAARDLAQLDLERTEIKAPVSGVIVARDAQLGAISATGGDPLFTLAKGGKIEFVADVIETALDQLAPGQPVEVQVAGIGEIAGRVRLTPASVDPVTRLGKLQVALADHSGLRPGLFASGSVLTAQRDALTVPARAVLSDENGTIVQLVEEGVVHSQPVEAGLLWQGQREILSGLQEGQAVISRAGAFFRDGDQVRSVDAGAVAASAADAGD